MNGEQRPVSRCRIWWREQTGKMSICRADKGMESGGPETLYPSLYPEKCCPINVAQGLFSCCSQSCWYCGGGGAGLHSCCYSSVSLHLSPQWETGAAGIWITTTWWDDFLSRDALKSPPFFFYQDALCNIAGSLTHCQSNYSDHL